MRVHPEQLSERTHAAGTPEGWVAYSKICTHAGCSVGLLDIDNRPPDVLDRAGLPVPPVGVRPARRRPPGRRAGDPLAPAARPRGRRRRLPRRHRRLRPPRRPPRLGRGVSAASDARDRRRRRGLVERYVDSVQSRVGGGSLVGKGLHKVFPNHFSFLWGELALYSFFVLLITGTYLTFFFEGSQQEVVYDGLVHAAAGRRGLLGLRVGPAHLLRRQGRPADPPDAPLGRARLRRRRRPAPRPGVLHRRVPPAARAQLGRRVPAAAARPGRRLHRLLAARRPAVGHRPADHPRHHPRHPVRRRAADVPDLRRRVAGHRHHRAALPGAHPDHPGADRRPRSAVHLGARVAPEAHPVPRAGPHASATSSASGCGRRSP